MQFNVSINQSGSAFSSYISKQCGSFRISGNSSGKLEMTPLHVMI